MARDYFDESKNKKKTTTTKVTPTGKKTATPKKSQSSSVSKPKTTAKSTTAKVNKTASKSTFLGGGASTQSVKKATTNNKPKTVKTQPTKQERINQKMYGSTTAPERRTKTATTNTQRAKNKDANLNLKQTVEQARRTRTEAQQQKLTGGVDVARARRQTQEIGNEIRRSVKDSLSEDNRAFAQRQKSGTLTAEDKKIVEQRNQRRAQIAKNTGAVAWKAAQDTVSGYGQSLADVDEMVKSNKNWTKAKAQKMGIDLNDKAKVSKVEQERQQSIKEAREFRQELFNKQEQRQAEWDERTKNAKGLEKAWYGAVESGTGMLADTAVGAVTGTGQFGALASMGLRTYGSSANQARKEGATDKEARLYGLAQSAKEVGTELMFQGAGLAKAAYGKTGLSLADKSANVLTKGLTGIKADIVGAGVRALGGTAEENVEELAGWVADPLIKELTYGKAVRNRMKENLRSNIPQIGSGADAANVASYFSTSKFTDELTNEYVKSGMSKDKAAQLAAEMRDYYVAYYSGDNKKLDALETDLAAKLSGQDKLSLKSWSMDELKDTLASTTLLTLATGMPGAVNSSIRGNQIFDSDEVKAVFGNDAVRKVADAVKNSSNKEMSLKAETMKDRLDSGKDLTGTQKFDLYQGYIEKVNETSKKARASQGVIENAREQQNLVPTMGIDRAGNTVYAKATQQEYNEKFESTAATAEAYRRFMESDNSISDDEIRRTDAAIKAVADLHVGGLTIGDAHEFAYGNTLARETLKAEEGIDLDRYIVRDANGNVDLAATNEATENALFQINADNAIKAAQAETEVYIDDTRGNIDKDLLTRFGNNGQAVWKEVNKNLDPRNLQEYLTTANAASYFYSAGRNTDMSVDSAINRYADTFKTVDNTVLKRAFAAGARDRIIANTPGYGQTVEAGSNIQLKKTEPIITGQLIMDDDVVIPDSDQSAYLALAMSTNANIHIVSNLNAMGKDGKPIIDKSTGLPVQLNGMSHGNDIYLNMNEAAEKNLGYVFMHEMTHQIKQYAPNEYLALENLVRDKWFNKDAIGMQAAIKSRQELYSVKGGQQLTEEEAVEEIIADAMAEVMDDPNFAAEVCEQDINLGQEILNSIRTALRSIRQIFASSDMKNDRFHNSLLSYLGILDEAEKMWIRALHTARQNKADGLIADWQDNANRQNSPRLSVGEEKYSITTDKEDFVKGANLSKDLRDWAKEMGLDKLSSQPVKGPVIVSVRDLRTAWYEKNGRADEAQVINTALDKIGDSLTQLVGKYQYIDLGDALNAAVTYRTDAEGHPTSVILSCQVKNAEYEVNFDFTTICAKRLAMQKILERFIKTEGERQGTTLYDELKLDEEGLYKLRLILETAGFEVSCRGCFVEQNRYSQQNQARTIANDWNAALDEWAKDNGTEVTENFGLTTLDIDNLDYEEIEAGFERYHELMKGKKTDVATKNRMLIEASPFFRKRMNASDYASMAGQRALMAIGESKKGGTNLYGLLKRGQSDSKQSVPFTAYNGEISLLPDNMKGKSLYDYLLSIGGARAQSASDFQIEFVYDYMQMVADLSARGLPMHMYTKVIELAELFGMTGIKINLSAMCDVAEDLGGEYAGLKLVDGKYEYNISDQSIDYEKAVALQKKDGYSKNIGIIMVALSSQHMLKSLDDPDVRYIIGYHSSAMPVVVANMSNMGGATDYTKINKTNKLNEKGKALFDEAMKEAKGNTELEKYKDALRIFDEKIQEETAKKKKLPRRGNEYGSYMSAYGGNTADFNTYDSLLETKDARKTADKYLEYCMKNDLIPIYFPFAFHENYYKCEIYDFNMYDNNTGEYAPMESVQNIYPGLNMAAGETDTTAFTERVSEMMDERNRLNESLDSQYDAVFDEAKNTLKYSITGDDYMDMDASGIDHSELTHRADAPMTAEQQRDADYMDAVNSGNMEEAQRLVDEAAKMAGYDTPLYHGTDAFGFTAIDNEAPGADGFSFWAASREDASATYTLYGKRRNISDGTLSEDEQESMLDEVSSEIDNAIDEFRDLIDRTFSEWVFGQSDNSYLRSLVDEANPQPGNGDGVYDVLSEIIFDAYHDYGMDSEMEYDEWSEESEEGQALWDAVNNIEALRGKLADIENGEIKGGIYGLYANTNNLYELDAEGKAWNELRPKGLPELPGYTGVGTRPYKTRDVANWARENGYDGVRFKNIKDNGPYGRTTPFDVYAFFNPQEQVKSSDPVTYREDGSVIPLSERFDPTNNDLRYSLPTQDSEGNILTDGQMEYFKNSQARDISGRLVPVYHATDMGGFTVFDPEYSDDKRSLFFSSRRDVAKTYAYNGGDVFDFTPKKLNSWSDLIKYGRQLFSDADMSWDNDTDDANLGFELYDKQNGKPADIDYDDWLDLASNNDAHADDYRVKISLPYNDKEGETESISFEGDSMSDLLNNVSNGNIPHGGHYQVYLNLENPLIIEGNGQEWNAISINNRIPNETHLEIITDEYLDAVAESDEKSFFNEKKQMKDRGYDYKDDQLYFWDRYQKSKQNRKDAKKAREKNIVYIKTETGKRLEAEYSLDGIANAISEYYGFEEAYPEGVLIANKMLEKIGSGWNGHYYMSADELKQETGETHSTREWAAIAQSEGYDGVIFRNIVDVDNKTELFDDEMEEAVSDIYIAFSSNQVKDIRNENPTENPDIRYSITPEDEAMSRLAYEDAMSDSYAALQSYEASVIDGSAEEFFKGRAYSAGMDEESISRFYDALRSEDAVPSADAVFEADRVRRARSKEDFFNNVNAKWNDRWTTEGEVLDLKSVKKDITNLVKGVMANSDTDAKYRNEIVRQTLLDVRTAYQLMKQDRSDVASYLLYHSAQRMIEGVEFIKDDTAFREYKEIRDFLRGYRINAPEEFWENEPFMDFRKEYYGRLRIGKGNSNIEDVYSDLQSRWPHLFNEDERIKAGLKDKPWDLLQHIGVVVDSNVTPFMEAYSSEEAVALAYETADALYDIMAGGDRVVSLADSYKERFDEKTKAMKQRHAEAILRERKIKEMYEARISELKAEQKRALKTQKAKSDFEIATLKQNREFNIQRLKAEKARAIKEERQQFRYYKEEQKEKRAHNKYFESIQKSHKKLVERLLTNTADKHIPEQYKKELAKLLAAFDLQTEASKKRETHTGPGGYVRVDTSQKTIKMAAIKEALKNIENRSELFHVNDAITDIMDSLSSVEGETIDSLSASELQNIDQLLKALLHEFNRYEKVKIGAKNMQAADIAEAQTVSAIEHAKQFGPGNDYYGIKGWMDQIINMDEMTPAYMFKRIDPDNVGLGLMWKEIMRSQDKYIRNTAKIQKWMSDITGEFHNKGKLRKKYGADTIEKWRSTNYQQDFNLTNGTVTLTPAQMMSLYCLSKRNQAYGHMVGAGIVVAPVSFQAKIMSDLKRKTNRALPVILTDADIKQIVAALTPDQIKVADQLQELMSTKMADMGNEASMNVLGIKLFNESDYFPIKSDKAALERDLSNEEFENAIRNFGFTKAVQPGARNAIMVEDIFDVVAEHCNNMNLYNSYSETLNDFMKVFNKHTIMEDGSDYSVRQALAHAYSQKATTFIMEFIRDLNGNVSKGRATGLDNAMSDMLGRAKQASVFANIRVLLQQPTAITRAFNVINPIYLKGVSLADVAKGAIPTVTTEVMQEMFDHCPIALWKSWGYYDINMGRSIESIIMNEGNFLEDLATSAYGKADNITWAAIWQMVKEETKDLHPELKEGSDEFFEHCNERMSDVVAYTQVVDSPLHRSHLMRSKQLHHKIFSAFMSEPTLTFNMLRDGYVTAIEEWKKGNKGKAAKIMGKLAAVASLQAVTVAAAAAIADAIRGKNKGDGDDDDDSFGALWYTNFIENLKDEAKIWNKVYYIKDMASIAEGWDDANLALQGWKSLTDGFRQFDKKLFEGSKTPWWKIYYNLLGGVGYFTGVPVKTLMKDGRAIFEMFGGKLPESLVGEQKTDSVISEDSKLQSLRLFKGKDTDKPSASTSVVNVDLTDKWYDYENNPITVKDGSALDKLLNHFGINLTAAEKAQIAASQAQAEKDKKIEEISNKYADLPREERSKKVWAAVTTYYKNEAEDGKAFADMVASGEYGKISEMRRMYVNAGGGFEYFDDRVLEESKKALKKSIKYDQTDDEIFAQEQIRDYLTENDVSEAEISEIVYKSDTAKDMKVAFRLNDKELMMETLEPLVNAGLTYDDLVRLWDNRNRLQLSSYKGRYKDKLKSTGKFIWPASGTITSHFGYRNAPTAGASSNHPAIDIGVPIGTPVAAADGGVVIYAGHNSGYGNSVGIKHDNGMVTYYNHLDSWNVKVGDTVAQGQQIACSGNTGISTGPHLDFKILDADGTPVDPEKYLN